MYVYLLFFFIVCLIIKQIILMFFLFNYSYPSERLYLLHMFFALVISANTEDLPCDLAASKRPSKVLIQKQIRPLHSFSNLYVYYGILLLPTLHTL